jgi:hypothetical protein
VKSQRVRERAAALLRACAQAEASLRRALRCDPACQMARTYMVLLGLERAEERGTSLRGPSTESRIGSPDPKRKHRRGSGSRGSDSFVVLRRLHAKSRLELQADAGLGARYSIDNEDTTTDRDQDPSVDDDGARDSFEPHWATRERQLTETADSLYRPFRTPAQLNLEMELQLVCAHTCPAMSDEHNICFLRATQPQMAAWESKSDHSP